MAIAGPARRLLAPVGRPLRRAAVGVRTRDWEGHSHLIVAFDAAGWVLEYEARQLERIARDLGARLGPAEWAGSIAGQSVFHLSQFTLLLDDFEKRGNNLGVSFFHGRPGTPGMPEFDACFATMRHRHRDIDRIQVTNSAMEAIVLETGVAGDKVHRIPIGIDDEAFALRSPSASTSARRALGIPDQAFVVGSFQKDGVGWNDGLEPKLIKGPDVLLSALEQLRARVPELFVLVTGPARGYVRAGLERLNVPYRHVLLPGIDAVAQAYDALDVCLVTSRDEGGPRAVLEAMAKGVPLVTTRVGQAGDLVRHGENGWLVEVEDVDGIVEWTSHVAAAGDEALERVRRSGRETAEQNSYRSLTPRWRELLAGFVELRDAA